MDFAATLDPRLTLARPDLAEQALEGLIPAGAYRTPTAMQCSAPVAPVRTRPEHDGPQEDQLVFGERFDVLEEADGWAWGRAGRDGYVGWVEVEALSQPVLTPTHRVAALRTYAYAEPTFRSQPVALLTLNALVTERGREGRFVEVARIGWIAEPHLSDLLAFESDPVAVAERFMGAPYQWGGRESLGLDCSGLVQQALFACGRACPRDADQQEAALGSPVTGDVRRGDLVFWDGHVGWMLDDARVIHANSWHMAVAIDPIAEVDQRQRASGSAGARFRRL